MKPHGMLTEREAHTVRLYKQSSEAFAKMQALAVSFRGISRSRDATRLNSWLEEAQATGLTHMRKFVRTVCRDIGAIRNAITEPWSNGPAVSASPMSNQRGRSVDVEHRLLDDVLPLQQLGAHQRA